MTSIITNNSATVALQTLRSINNSLDETNNRVSTGKKINSAADGAAYWNIATTLSSDNGALGAVKDAISLDVNSVKTANAGIEQALKSLNTIKSALASAQSSTADRVSLQKDITNALSDIQSASDSAVMNGANWLKGKTADADYNKEKSLLSSFSRTDGAVTLGTTTLDTEQFLMYNESTIALTTAEASAGGTILAKVTDISKSGTFTSEKDVVVATSVSVAKGFMDTVYAVGVDGTTAGVSIKDLDISELKSTDTDLAKMAAYMKIVDATIQALQSGSTALGTTQTRLTSQQNFAQTLIDINTSSMGSLVDANMEEESTRLKALQTQQQLAVQSLSIANNNTSNIMTLFR
ncbi:flagellin [Xanthobacteraceae bacterium A53D]